MVNKELGKKLSEYRKAAGFTQKYVADYLTSSLSLNKPMSPKTVSSWEAGLAEPDAVTFLKLCNLYGVGDIMQEFAGEAVVPKEEPEISRDALEVAQAYEKLDESGKAMIRRALGLPEVGKKGKAVSA